jgi:hypothetical protein
LIRDWGGGLAGNNVTLLVVGVIVAGIAGVGDVGIIVMVVHGTVVGASVLAGNALIGVVGGRW